MLMENPQIDVSELMSSPSTWLTVLADAASKHDARRIKQAQDSLFGLGWLVLMPSDIALMQMTDAAIADLLPQQQEAPAAEPEARPVELQTEAMASENGHA